MLVLEWGREAEEDGRDVDVAIEHSESAFDVGESLVESDGPFGEEVPTLVSITGLPSKRWAVLIARSSMSQQRCSAW